MRHKIWLVATFILAGNGLLFAQATGTINGRVVDQAGAVIPAAAVTATNTSTGVARDTVTNAEGLYIIPALIPGVYDVQAKAPGFAPFVRKGVELVYGSVLTVDVQLGVAQIAQAVTVTGEVQQVETTQSAIAETLQQTEVAQLPMINRSLAALMELTPGAREVPMVPGSGSAHGASNSFVSFGGGSGRNFDMLVDGTDNKEDHDGGTTLVYSLEGVQEFSVYTTSNSAEYGKASNTVILATKSGTNQIHGSAFGYGRNQALTAIDYFSKPENGGIGKPAFDREQYGGSIGGPLRKDHVWYFASVEKIGQNFNLVRPLNVVQQFTALQQALHLPISTSPLIPEPQTDLLAQGKINFQLSPKDSLFVRFGSENGYINNIDITTTQAILSNAPYSVQNRQDMYVGAIGWTRIISPSTVNQFAVQYLYYRHNSIYPTCDPSICLLQSVAFPTETAKPDFHLYPHWYNHEKKGEIKDDLSKQIGAHSLKVGVDFERLFTFGAGGVGSGAPGSINFFDDPITIINNTTGKYPQGFLTPGIVRSISVSAPLIGSNGLPNPAGDDVGPKGSWSLGAYIQDDYKISPRLTLNLGLRYDVYQYMDQPNLAQNRIYQVLKAIGSPYGKLPNTDTRDIAPRVGIAWDIRGNGKDVARLSFGTFYSQGIYNTYIGPTAFDQGVLEFSQTYANSAIGSGALANYIYGVTPLPTAPTNPTQLPVGQSVAGSVYDPNLRDPYTEKYHAGLSHLFSATTVLSADYTHLAGRRGWRGLDINPLLPNPNLTPACPNAVARPLCAVTASMLGDPNLLGTVNKYSSVNHSFVDELDVHFERRFSGAAALQVNYSLAWARGMGAIADDTTGASVTAPQAASASGGDITAPWEWGPTPFDERHRVTVVGVFNLPWAIDVSPSFTAATARPYTQFRGNNTSGDGLLQILGPDGNPAGLDNARGQALVNANARVSKNFKISENMKISLFTEFYNIFNRANFGNQYNGNAFSPTTYNKPFGYLGGIGSLSTIANSFQVQFGGRFSF